MVVSKVHTPIILMVVPCIFNYLQFCTHRCTLTSVTMFVYYNGTLIHVSAPWCHGALRSLLKLHTIIILQNVMVKIKNWLKLMKLIKTATVVGGGCMWTQSTSNKHCSNITTVAHTATANNSCCFINFNQFLILTITFCKFIIVCNFSKERRAPWGWQHAAETCRSVPYNIRTL